MQSVCLQSFKVTPFKITETMAHAQAIRGVTNLDIELLINKYYAVTLNNLSTKAIR